MRERERDREREREREYDIQGTWQSLNTNNASKITNSYNLFPVSYNNFYLIPSIAMYSNWMAFDIQRK